jgi:flagellar motor switch protein FliN/FliY
MDETVMAAEASVEPEFAEFDEGAAVAVQGPDNISLLYDLTLPISIELGRTKMTVQEVLALTRGSVIQLDRLVGEAIDIFVGERRFAQGEVVVLGEQFGVRITRILAQPSAELSGE